MAAEICSGFHSHRVLPWRAQRFRPGSSSLNGHLVRRIQIPCCSDKYPKLKNEESLLRRDREGALSSRVPEAETPTSHRPAARRHIEWLRRYAPVSTAIACCHGAPAFPPRFVQPERSSCS